MPIDRDQVIELAKVVEGLEHLPLEERVLAWVREARSRGLECFAQRVEYLAVAQGVSTVAQTYSLTLVDAEGYFLQTGMSHPSPGTADILATSMRVNSMGYVDSDAIMDAWCEDDTSEDGRGWPWPMVWGPRDTWSVVVGGTALTIVGIQLRGFNVDELTAAVFRQVGELFVEGFNQTFAAATVMGASLPRTANTEKEISYLVAKETLGGDAVRANLQLAIKGVRINPRDTGGAGASIPPISMRKPGARVSIGIAPGDSYDQQPRYTSAAGTGTAKLQVTHIGRRKYRSC